MTDTIKEKTFRLIDNACEMFFKRKKQLDDSTTQYNDLLNMYLRLFKNTINNDNDLKTYINDMKQYKCIAILFLNDIGKFTTVYFNYKLSYGFNIQTLSSRYKLKDSNGEEQDPYILNQTYKNNYYTQEPNQWSSRYIPIIMIPCETMYEDYLTNYMNLINKQEIDTTSTPVKSVSAAALIGNSLTKNKIDDIRSSRSSSVFSNAKSGAYMHTGITSNKIKVNTGTINGGKTKKQRRNIRKTGRNIRKRLN